MSLAAGEARDAASKAVADGKQVIDTTKGEFGPTSVRSLSVLAKFLAKHFSISSHILADY